MADKSKAGTALRPYSFRVERIKIRELVNAIGDDNPIFLDQEEARS